MKKLYFIHSRNREKIGVLMKGDTLIYLDERATKNNDALNLEEYAKKVFVGQKKCRFAYNTDFLQKWAFTRFSGQKSFVEELVYDNFSLWYQLEFLFLCDVDYQLGYELSIPGITWYIDIISKIIDEKKPSEVVVENKKDQLNQIILKICMQKGIKCRILGFPGKKNSFSNWFTHHWLVIDQYTMARIALRRLVAKMFCKKFEKSEVLFLTSDRLSNKDNKSDYFWGPIIKELDRKKKTKYKVVEYDRIDSFQSLTNLKKRYMPQRYDSQFIGTYYDHQTMAYLRKIKSFLKKKYRELINKKHFRDGFEYKKIRFYDIMKPRLKKVFLGFPGYIADTYAVSKSIVEKEKPGLVVVDHEKNYYGRALITYAKINKIPSLCFEGEIVYDDNTYQTQIPIKEINNESSPIWKPLPTRKLLWGEYNKLWHTTKNYIGPGKLKVIGSPKYDFLKAMDKKTNAEIRQRYGVASDDLLVTIITVLLPEEEYYIRTILASLKDFRNVKVIIKMHPTDPVKNMAKHEKILKEMKTKGTVVINENSSKLIHASDLVVTYPSTLVYECIILDKQVIVLGDETNLNQPYIKDGLMRMNTSLAQLGAEVKSFLSSSKKMDPALRKQFISKYLYSDDGKSSQRAVGEIEEMLAKHQN